MRIIKFLKTIEHIALALLVGVMITPMLVDLAYRERGYVGFGGEWLLILIIIAVAYLIIRKKDEPKEEGEDNA